MPPFTATAHAGTAPFLYVRVRIRVETQRAALDNAVVNTSLERHTTEGVRIELTKCCDEDLDLDVTRL